MSRRSSPDREPVAVIGVAGRYPGARNLDEFWQNLAAGRDCVTELPPERRRAGWPLDIMAGGYLADVDRFDPFLFSIVPAVARRMDPHERLFLEVAWEALEDAGYNRDRLRRQSGARVGVYVGAMYADYAFFGVERAAAGVPDDSGNTIGDIANRVSFFLDLHGPSLSVDTMCSSALAAIHLAVRAIQHGECAMAIAGASNLSLHPNKFRTIDRLAGLSTDHRCRSFAAGGDGIVPSEGVGAVILKPLSQARSDGDRIQAVILGSSLIHTGRTNGYMVPDPHTHARMIAEALADAAVDPATISYIEAHGTGTASGDPIEVEGMTEAFAAAGLPPGAIAIGSVKSNLGHGEAAAGMAGLSKIILQLRHRTLAPTIHADELNDGIAWSAVPFRVQRTLSDWIAPPDPAGGSSPLRAGLSSMGAGGTIAHLIVEGPGAVDQVPPTPASGGPHLVVLSGYDEDRLRAVVQRLLTHLAGPAEPALPDLAFTLQVGREQLRQRLAVVVASVADLRERLRRFGDGDSSGVLRGQAVGGSVATLPTGRADADGLRALGAAWVTGAAVDWAALRRLVDPHRPARTIELPSYPFARMRCWVSEPEIPPAVGVAGTPAEIPLYRQDWLPADDGDPAAPPSAATLVCLFATGTEHIAAEIARTHGATRTVLIRDATHGGDGAGHGLVLTDAQQADAVADRLLAEWGRPACWVDLTDLEHPDPNARSWAARTVLLQRVVGHQSGAELRAVHVTRGLQQLDGAPPMPYGARMAAQMALLSAEYRQVRCVTMDTDVALAAAPALAEQVYTQLWRTERYGRVAYRAGRRYTPALVAVDAPYRPLELDPAGAYLVTGATRGLGALVAGHLVARGARALVLVGARTLPDRADWDRPGLPERSAAAIAMVRGWERAGVRVFVHYGQLGDSAGIASLLDRMRSGGTAVRGVVHCAGGLVDGAPAFIRRDLRALAAVQEPKIAAVELLAGLVEADRPAFFLTFSSGSATVPAVASGVLDYAAANAAMDLFIDHRIRAGHPWYRSVTWPQWSQSGAGKGQPNRGAVVGLDALTDAEGLRVIDRVLALPDGGVLLPVKALDETMDPTRLIELRPAPAPAVPTAAATTAPATMASAGSMVADAPPGWLVDILAEVLGISAGQLDATMEFADLGVESVMLGELLDRIERHLDRRLEPATLLEHSTLDRLAAHLRPLVPPPAVNLASAVMPAEASSAMSAEARASSVLPAGITANAGAPRAVGPAYPPDGAAVAIIGMACRFPDAGDVEAFWANLTAGRCAIREVPTDRWDHRQWYRSAPGPGAINGKWGGFVDGIDLFDPGFFGMSEAEATYLDPGIRLFLESTVTACADAGYSSAELAGGQTGVFVGGRVTNYAHRGALRSEVLHSDPNFIAAQVAHFLDVHGPNLVVDSACSSSLVAVHLAAQALRTGDCDLAIAGGVSVLLDEEPYLEFSAGRALSPNGRCAPFDERANGFVPGEGCGVVLLKRLADAIADGDRIQAVIESSAVNNDGRTMGITTPNPVAQAAVVRRALSRAGRTAADIGLVEAHGTGTAIGDPIELRALTDVFRETTDLVGHCAVGSVKSNLGHLLHAAGVAGLIKVALAVERGQLPPTLSCDRPNPRFDFASSPFRLNRETLPWLRPDAGRVAGVSSFGLGGTNAHCVVSDAVPMLARQPTRSALPPPVFRRRRLWIDKPSTPAVERALRPERAGDEPQPEPAPQAGVAERTVEPAAARMALLELTFTR